MLADLLTKEFMWNSYIKFFLPPFQNFLPWLIIIAIAGIIINKILDHLYYRLILSGNSKSLASKRCRVLCSGYESRTSNKD